MGRKRSSVSEADVQRLGGVLDISQVRTLDLSGHGFESLGAVARLEQLRELNVSGNALTTLKELDGLKHLRVLYASDNLLRDLRGLEGLKALETVVVHGNKIASYENDVRPFLRTLPALRTVAFQARDSAAANPFCRSASYPTQLVQDLPQLQAVDGDRLAVMEGARAADRDAPSGAAPPPALQLPEPQPWPTDFGSPLAALSAVASGELAEEAAFREALAACRAICSSATL